MTRFRTPKRRLTRQRSGFNVSGVHTGSTCKIEDTKLISPQNNLIIIDAYVKNESFPKLFNKNLGVFGFGIYLCPTSSCIYSGEVSWKLNQTTNSFGLPEATLISNRWNRRGLIVELPLNEDSNRLARFSLRLQFRTSTELSIYGLVVGTLKHEYFINNDVHSAFRQKQDIYIPEMLYHDPTINSVTPAIVKGTQRGIGRPIMTTGTSTSTFYGQFKTDIFEALG